MHSRHRRKNVFARFWWSNGIGMNVKWLKLSNDVKGKCSNFSGHVSLLWVHSAMNNNQHWNFVSGSMVCDTCSGADNSSLVFFVGFIKPRFAKMVPETSHSCLKLRYFPMFSVGFVKQRRGPALVGGNSQACGPQNCCFQQRLSRQVIYTWKMTTGWSKLLTYLKGKKKATNVLCFWEKQSNRNADWSP